MKQILIGISGGIDSAAATLKLRGAGYDVTALWIDMLGCAVQKHRVEELCRGLDVPLVIEEVSENFQQSVIAHTLREHQAGRTPSPCAVCNVEIKWKTLCKVADRLGIFHIATGHYVQIALRNEMHYIARGVDSTKDQSYYLYALDEQTLARAITPLGDMYKTDVRAYLASQGFVELATGGESQGLCFVESGYGDFLRRNLSLHQGDVVDENGVNVGTHDGYQLYTIGQKRGFSATCTGEVRRVDAERNEITIGRPLMNSVIECYNATYRPFPTSEPTTIAVRGLGRNPKGSAEISTTENKLTIRLTEDTAWAITKGQPVVVYCGDIVVGGGIAF